ncbi:hypothetical protein N9948_00585 [bacterium]|nr:hypothetical protein [bacterium]
MERIKKLRKESLPVLLKKFEGCIQAINYNRAVAFKIVSIIDKEKLLKHKSNYSSSQLVFLQEKHGVSDPWNLSTQEVLEHLYSHFSWPQYVRFGKLIENIDMKVATKLNEDALIALNKNKDSIKKITPMLVEIKAKVIKRNHIDTIVVDIRRKEREKEIRHLKKLSISDIEIPRVPRITRPIPKKRKKTTPIYVARSEKEKKEVAKTQLKEAKVVNVELHSKLKEVSKVGKLAETKVQKLERQLKDANKEIFSLRQKNKQLEKELARFKR